MPEVAPVRVRAADGLHDELTAAVVAAGGDRSRAAHAVCRVVADAFGDPVVMRLADGAGILQAVGLGATRGVPIEEILAGLEPGAVPVAVAEVFRSGEAAQVCPEGNQISTRPALQEFQRRVGYRGSLIAPLRAHGRIFGTLSVLCSAHEEHPPGDLDELVVLADRCAVALDDACLLDHHTQELSERSLAERRRAALLDHTSDVIIVASRLGKVVDVAPSVERVLGWDPAALVGRSIFDIVEVGDRARVAREFGDATTGRGLSQPIEFRVRHADDSVRWMEATANNLLHDPAVAALVITARDVTERHLGSELLVAENQLLQRVVGGAPLARVYDDLCQLVESRIARCIASVWELDGPTRVVLRAAPRIDAGYIGREVGLGPYAERADGTHPPLLEAVVDPEPKCLGFEDVVAGLGVVGSWSRAIVTPEGLPLGSVVLFFTERRPLTPDEIDVLELASHLAAMAAGRDRSSQDMAHAATHDGLTGLPNRVLFLDRLDQVLHRSGGDVAVLFVDLDDFKAVNDTAGHAAGDQLLCQVAARLAAVVRPRDLIARLGGDEFAMLCDGLDVQEAGAVARRVLEALDEPFDLDGRPFHVSASAGIAVGGADSTPDTVLRDADTAMYQAKRDGRARYAVFTPAVREATVRRLALEQHLRRAIERCELTLEYQPVVGLGDGALLGLEALARWRSPEHGVVSPLEFIDVAERAGMISALGACVLQQAANQAATWRAAGLIGDGVTVAVNVAAQQLADPAFVPSVVGALQDAGLPPEALGIELTESAVMADVEGAQATLGLLRSLGITLAIDDFGTGHSSLARLRSIEATVLKLDRMFILDLEVDRACVEMVQGVIQLAHALGKRLVVEGVEQPAQLRILRDLGADAAQGFHLARPQSAAAIEGLLRVTPRWQI